MDRRRTTGALTIAIAVFAGISACCREKKCVADSSRVLSAEINAKTNSPTANATNGDSDDERVYLDATLSMKGFVNPKQHSAFDDFLEQIGDVLPGCRLYKYGQRGTTPPRNSSELISPATFGSELHQSNFYDLSYNPDDRLISDLAAEQQPVFSILISDGVYSEPNGSTTPPMVDAIRAWIATGRVFGVFVLKSAFNGPFYSERLRTWLPTVSVTSRPFYAFVFSPNPRRFEDIREKLQRRFPTMQTFLFSDESVSCFVDTNLRIPSLYDFTKPPSTPYAWSMYDSNVFRGQGAVDIDYRLIWTLAPEYAVSDFKTDTSASFYRWQNKTFVESQTQPPGFSVSPYVALPDSNSERPKQPAPDFVIHYPKDTTTTYSFYAIAVRATPRSIRPEIQELSTRDDGIRENANKTYRFFEFMTAVSDVHFKTRLAAKASPQMFVTLANN